MRSSAVISRLLIVAVAHASKPHPAAAAAAAAAPAPAGSSASGSRAADLLQMLKSLCCLHAAHEKMNELRVVFYYSPPA